MHAYAAVMADNRLARIIVITNGLYHTGPFAAAASDAFVGIQQHAPSLAQVKRPGGADFGAVRLTACMTNRGNKPALQPSAGPDMNAAFPDRMILPVYTSANQHTGKAADAFTHFIRSDYSSQSVFHPR